MMNFRFTVVSATLLLGPLMTSCIQQDRLAKLTPDDTEAEVRAVTDSDQSLNVIGVKNDSIPVTQTDSSSFLAALFQVEKFDKRTHPDAKGLRQHRHRHRHRHRHQRHRHHKKQQNETTTTKDLWSTDEPTTTDEHPLTTVKPIIVTTEHLKTVEPTTEETLTTAETTMSTTKDLRSTGEPTTIDEHPLTTVKPTTVTEKPFTTVDPTTESFSCKNPADVHQNNGYIETSLQSGCVAGTCSWKFQYKIGVVIGLSFEQYSTEEVQDRFSSISLSDRATCVGDISSLRLYDGPDRFAPNIASFCADRRPESTDHFRSSGNHFYVELMTFGCTKDNSSIKFRAKYNAINISVESATDSASNTPTNGSCQCGRQALPPSIFSAKIVGGLGAMQNSWPWQISLREQTSSYSFFELTNDWNHICGGSIIDKRWVVTAAHCVSPSWYGESVLSNLRVVVGDHDLNTKEPTEKWLGIESKYIHPNYSSTMLFNDIALLRLADDVTFNDYVRPICLPEDVATVGLTCVATGWGSTSATETRSYTSDLPGQLRQVRLPIQPLDVCRPTIDRLRSRATESSGFFSWNYETPSSSSSFFDESAVICAGYTNVPFDTCHGDSGGPLACYDSALVDMKRPTWTLYGLTSSGIGCGDYKHYPGGLYTRVDNFVNWIRVTMNLHN